MWATDRSPTTERVLPLARELAESNGAKLIDTHVEKITTIAGKPVFNHSTATLDADLYARVDGLVEAGVDAELLEAEAHKGGTAHRFVQLAKDADADLIMLDSHGKGSLDGVFLGHVPHSAPVSHTERRHMLALSREMRCPVGTLVLNPRAFANWTRPGSAPKRVDAPHPSAGYRVDIRNRRRRCTTNMHTATATTAKPASIPTSRQRWLVGPPEMVIRNASIRYVIGMKLWTARNGAGSTSTG